MKRALFLHLLLFIFGLEAKEDLSPITTYQEEITINIKGINLITTEDVNKAALAGINIYIKIPQNEKKLRSLLHSFIGKIISKKVLQEIKKIITHFFAQNKRPVVAVTIPQQDITNGCIKVIVTESKVGKVTWKANKWSSEKELNQSLRIKHGDPIDTKEILSELNWLNRNPFRRVNVVLQPGERVGTTDLSFVLSGDKSYKIFSGIDSTGFGVSNRARPFIGYATGNLWGLGHIVNYQYTFSTDLSAFNSHTLQYVLPLPWKHLFRFVGGYSFTKSPILQEVSQIKGLFTQLSFFYIIPLQPTEMITHEIHFGVEYKKSTTNLFFLRKLFEKNKTSLLETSCKYDFLYKNNNITIPFSIETIYSPGILLLSSFVYLQLYGNPQFSLTSLGSIENKWKVQLSLQKLPPSEQMGLGGMHSIRGYAEREVISSNAFFSSFEWHSPHLSFSKKKKDNLYGVFFADIGYGLSSSVGIASTWLLGIGPGFRFSWNHYFSSKLDFGYQLIKSPFYQSPNYRLYYSMIASF